MIIGTAGHIDHGKSALVEALTGKGMDPLAEERRRGITLDLHFAPLRLAGGRIAGVIDVPGHEDLIRTMVAGAAGLDLVLLIVAADEGIMPQTREHLAIVEQLRVPAGIPVITKSDLVEPEWLAMVESDLVSWLAQSPVRFTSPLATSSVRGTGIAQLQARIESTVATLKERDSDDLFRLPVDRGLSLPGTGTVVTGTAWSGSLRVGDAVALLPGGAEGRVRSLQRHGHEVEVSAPGDRVAVGIAGLDRDQVRRGVVLVRRADPWHVSHALDVSVDLLKTAPRPLVHHSRVRLSLATDEVMARVQAADPVSPGESGLVRLALERPLLARGGDRFVLRSFSPVGTIGGGCVVDPMPFPGRPRWPDGIADPNPAKRLGALVERRPAGLEYSALPVVLGLVPREAERVIAESGVVRVRNHLVTRAAVSAAAAAAMEGVADFHRRHPAENGMPLETLRQSLARRGAAGELAIEQLLETAELVANGSLVRNAPFQPRVEGGSELVDRLVVLLEQAGLTPPSISELEGQLRVGGLADALRLAARAGRIEAVDRDRYFSAAALAEFRQQVRKVASHGPITPQALRDETGLSRKYLIPLLEWCDRSGLTARSGDRRVLVRPRVTPTGGA
jgi:selenocysteine-specific elongation factor